MRGKLFYQLLSERLRHVSFKGLKKDHAEAFAAFIQFLEQRGDDRLINILVTAEDLINDRFYVFIFPQDANGKIKCPPLVIQKLKTYPASIWKPILCDKLGMHFDEVVDAIAATR